MNRRILALLLALVMVAGLMTGCASGKQEAAAPETAQTESPAAEETTAEPEQTEEVPAEEEAPKAPKTVSFTDSLGRTVELPADITRIAPSGAVAPRWPTCPQTSPRSPRPARCMAARPI